MERTWQHRRAFLEASESSAKEGWTWQNSRSQHLIRRCPFLTHCSLGARTTLNHVSHQHSSSQPDTWAPLQQPPPGRLPARHVGFQLMPTCPSPCIQLWKTCKGNKSKTLLHQHGGTLQGWFNKWDGYARSLLWAPIHPTGPEHVITLISNCSKMHMGIVNRAWLGHICKAA